MKAEELRVGNLMMEGEITLADFYNMYLDGDCPYTQIPLTEEWLVKFGFKKHPLNNVFWERDTDKFNFGIFQYDDGTYNHPSSSCKTFQYIHQLQNLYFALTGQELTT